MVGEVANHRKAATTELCQAVPLNLKEHTDTDTEVHPRHRIYQSTNYPLPPPASAHHRPIMYGH